MADFIIIRKKLGTLPLHCSLLLRNVIHPHVSEFGALSRQRKRCSFPTTVASLFFVSEESKKNPNQTQKGNEKSKKSNYHRGCAAFYLLLVLTSLLKAWQCFCPVSLKRTICSNFHCYFGNILNQVSINCICARKKQISWLLQLWICQMKLDDLLLNQYLQQYHILC